MSLLKILWLYSGCIQISDTPEGKQSTRVIIWFGRYCNKKTFICTSRANSTLQFSNAPYNKRTIYYKYIKYSNIRSKFTGKLYINQSGE